MRGRRGGSGTRWRRWYRGWSRGGLPRAPGRWRARRPRPARAGPGDPGHVPARQGVAAGGRERKGARAGGRKKVHLLAAGTRVPGIVIAQGKAAQSGKAGEISRFRPLLAPLPLDGTVVTSDAMQANRDNALFLRKEKTARYLWPVPATHPTQRGAHTPSPRTVPRSPPPPA